MAGSNRTTLINKLRTALRKRYKPHVTVGERSVLQHLLYACCLEQASYQAADDAFAAVSETFFDWNEVRVSTSKELAEVMHRVPGSTAAAQRLRRCLQSLFEQTYTFDLESIKKLGLGQAAKRLAELGATPFAVAHVMQMALGGHAIPTDAGTLRVLELLGIVTAKEAASGAANGLERAVPKAKGLEFVSLLHQFAADFSHDPYSSEHHQVLLEVTPEVRSRLPQKPTKKELAQAAAAKVAAEVAAKTAAKARRAAAEKAVARPEPPRKGQPPEKPDSAAARAKAASMAKKPLPATAKPVPPAAKPSAPAAKPTAPVAKSVPPVKPAVPSAAKPQATPSAKPAVPSAAKPAASAAKPAASSAKSTTPAAKPDPKRAPSNATPPKRKPR